MEHSEKNSIEENPSLPFYKRVARTSSQRVQLLQIWLRRPFGSVATYVVAGTALLVLMVLWAVVVGPMRNGIGPD